MKRFLPLRISILLALFGLSLAFTIIDAAHGYYSARRAITANALRRAASIGNLMSPVLSTSGAQGGAPDANDELRRLARIPDVAAAVVVDGQGRVVAASEEVLLGRPLAATPLAEAAPLVERSRAGGGIEEVEERAGTAVDMATPLARGAGPGTTPPAVLLLRMDLLPARRAALAGILETMLLMGGMALLAGLLVWLYFRATFSRQLDQLVQGVSRYAAGRGDLRVPDEGNHELAMIGRVVNQLFGDLSVRNAALRDSEARFRAVVDNSFDGIVFADAQGRILYRSPSYHLIDGYREEERLGQEAFQTVHPDDIDKVRALWTETVRNPEARRQHEFRTRHRDGSWRWIEASAHNLLGNPNVQAIIVSARDITERRRSEEARTQLQTMLIQSQKMEAVGQLAGGVAHDFNNILTALLLRLNLVSLEKRLSPEVRAAVEELTRDANRAAALTRQLLLFSRRQVMEMAKVELNSVVGNLLRMLRRLIGETISLEWSGAAGDLWIEADTGMLEQVVMNLVVNARDAMAGGGRVTLRTLWLDVDEAEAARHPRAVAGRYACLEVQDTGSGIEPAVAEHIFEPFFTTKEAGKGTGLGLATVWGIVQQHRGYIEFETTPGAGTTFRVMLPSCVAPLPSDKGSSLEAVERGHERVLVVEDDPAVRQLLVRALEQRGYLVESAADGPGAMECWRRADPFDLVVTDMVMPGGTTGLELLEALLSERPSLRVILMSGYGPELADRDLLSRRGIVVLSKPIDASAFTRAVRQILDRSGSR